MVTTPLVVVVLLVVTLGERGFLKTNGWSAIHRTHVEWPSLLALGPYGVAVVVTFAVAGFLVVTFGAALWAVAISAGERVAGLILLVAGVALSLEAFPTDRPEVTHESWHAHIHNLVYPLIPGCLLTASLTFAVLKRTRTRRTIQRLSRVALPIFAAAVAASFVGPVAQLGRYVLFGAALLWLEAIAVSLVRESATRPVGCTCSTS